MCPPRCDARCASAVKHSFQKKILEGLDLNTDFLNWIPLLEKAQDENASWPLDSPVTKLGPACFGRVAMAAVEQKAMQKKLNPGTVESLRCEALNLFLSAATNQAFFDGITDVLHGLAKQKPELSGWIGETWVVGQEKYNQNWRMASRFALHILTQIRDQTTRKGQRGNPGRQGTHHLQSIDAAFLEYIDATAIKTAAGNTPILNINRPEVVRENIRPVVRDFLARGILRYDPTTKSPSEALDVHTRRVLRKFDELTTDQFGNLLRPLAAK